MKKLLLLAAMIGGISAIYAAEFAKVHNFTITLADTPTEIEKSAAAELKEHLSKTFTAPAQLNGKTPAKINLFVGASAQARKAGFNGDLSAAQAESKFGIFRNNNDFLFVGFDTPNGDIHTFRDSCGTLLAVEYFAQKYLQAKFFMPGKNGAKYAVNPAINFAGTSDIPEASFVVRGFQYAAKDIDRNDFMLFFRRRLGQVPPWASREYYYAFLNKWNKRLKDKPEMFAMHGKKRFMASYPNHFPCPSHPDTVKQIVEDISAAVRKNPKIKAIRFFCDAPVKSCECTLCVNSPAGKLVTAGDRSEFVFAFFCKFANELKKRYPDMIFHLQTKSSHFQPPRTEKLPADTLIAVLSGHFNAPDYTVLQKRCRQWEKAGAKVVLYSYPRAPEMKTYPIMNPHRIADHFKIMQGYALGATMYEGKAKTPYTFSALNTYVHSAVMFDCSLDTDKLIAEFCNLIAPQAAKELQNFYQAMEKLLDNAAFRDDPLSNCYLSFRLKEPRKLLDKAVAKDPANKFLQDLSQDFAGFEKISQAASSGIVSEAEYNALLKKLNEKQPPIKLTANGTTLEFKPFAIFRDFQNTRVGISRDGEDLKLDFVCQEEKISKLRLRCKTNHAGAVWNDDAVEIFLAPAGKALPRLHIAVNASGIYRVIYTDTAGNSRDAATFELFTRATRERGRWQLTVKIPAGEIKKIAEQNKFGLGLYRHRPTKSKVRSKTQISGVQKPSTGSFNSLSGRFDVEF